MPEINHRKRRCGDCTACCTVMGVEDYQPEPKQPGVRCSDLCSRGCRRYQTRPESCREFQCAWLQGALPNWMRPDKIGVVFVGDPADDERLLGHVDLKVGDRWLSNEPLVAALTLLSRAGVTVALGATGTRKVSHQFRGGKLMVRPPEADVDA